jgi:hypothetical protein
MPDGRAYRQTGTAPDDLPAAATTSNEADRAAMSQRPKTRTAGIIVTKLIVVSP